MTLFTRVMVRDAGARPVAGVGAGRYRPRPRNDRTYFNTGVPSTGYVAIFEFMKQFRRP